MNLSTALELESDATHRCFRRYVHPRHPRGARGVFRQQQVIARADREPKRAVRVDEHRAGIVAKVLHRRGAGQRSNNSFDEAIGLQKQLGLVGVLPVEQRR